MEYIIAWIIGIAVGIGLYFIVNRHIRRYDGTLFAIYEEGQEKPLLFLELEETAGHLQGRTKAIFRVKEDRPRK